MPRHFILLLMVCSMAAALGGCGFHLRGTLGDVEPLPPIYLRGDAADPLFAELDQTLRGAGTAVVDDPANAHWIFDLTGVDRSRRVLSVGASGRAQEYELHYAVHFGVQDAAGRILLGDQTLNVVRDLEFDETEVMSKSNEEEQLFRDMRHDAVRQLVLRLQALRSSTRKEAPAPAPGPAPNPPPAQPAPVPMPDSENGLP